MVLVGTMVNATNRSVKAVEGEGRDRHSKDEENDVLIVARTERPNCIITGYHTGNAPCAEQQERFHMHLLTIEIDGCHCQFDQGCKRQGRPNALLGCQMEK